MSPLEIIINFVTSGIFLIYWGITFVILYHLTRFGIGVQPKRFAAFFLFGSVIFSGIAVVLFARIDISAFVSLIPR